ADTLTSSSRSEGARPSGGVDDGGGGAARGGGGASRGGGAAGSAGTAASSPAPSTSSSASTAPMATVPPAGTWIRTRRPSTGEGISALTLSVTTSTIGSSRRTRSPSFLSQRSTVPSVTDSPSCGILSVDKPIVFLLHSQL